MSSDVTSAVEELKEAINGCDQSSGDSPSLASPKVEGRVSPVTLKLKNIPDSAGSVLEMVVEKVKAREGTVSPPLPKLMLGLEENKEVGKKRRASNDSEDSSVTKASESNTEEKDDDEDNEDDDTIGPGENVDPERLKSFNMFVRLFVDENLDRTVPISKQPKDKIQAILEACDRQFAEFHDRSRKRVRTYLKSCRRLKKSKDGGFEPVKQTPPHLTSAAAEQILAQACENESENAKRMRMGLEPLPAHLMNNSRRHEQPSLAHQSKQNSPVASNNNSSSSSTNSTGPIPVVADLTHVRQGSRSPNVEKLSRKRGNAMTPDLSSQGPPPAKTANTSYRLPASGGTPIGTTSREAVTASTPPYNLSNGVYRSGLPSSSSFTSPPAHQQISLLQNSLSSSYVQNGPTDLSMKGKPHHNNNNNTSRKVQQLSAQEVATIQSLIAGYRESAAFLYRSAEELEQILQQQK